MARAGAQPTRFAVQRARGNGWKTVFVDEQVAVSERMLREMIRVNPKGCFRLIRLEHNPEANFEGLEFHWTLVALHAPKAGQVFTGLSGASMADAPAAATPQPRSPSPARRQRPRLALPILAFALAMLAGVLIATIAYLGWGPAALPPLR